jgi:hypothetical protein
VALLFPAVRGCNFAGLLPLAGLVVRAEWYICANGRVSSTSVLALIQAWCGCDVERRRMQPSGRGALHPTTDPWGDTPLTYGFAATACGLAEVPYASTGLANL